jgi:D-alanyl-D-alanine carboxypeptidase
MQRVVLAENIAGSEKNFARLMTIRARQLGMKHHLMLMSLLSH